MYVAAMIRGQTIARNYANPVAVARCLEKKKKGGKRKERKKERKEKESGERGRRERARSFYSGYVAATGQRGKNTLGQE